MIHTRFALRVAALAALFLSATAAFAADPKPTGDKTGLIPRTVFFGNPDVRSPQISPDGKRLAWLAPFEGVLNIWVAPTDDIAGAKVVTHDKTRPIPGFSWAYTSDHLLYTQDHDGDEDFHVYCVDLKSDAVMDLTPLQKIRAELIERSPKFPKELVVGINDRDPRFHDLYRVDLTTGERKLLEKNLDFAGFEVDDEFNVRFAEKYAADGGMQV
ncbi:MAG TPA: hypothetical protein VMS17_14225, partial [Gemmataceae bacterium]|nr:hypothetical protein [Gemmataceae bacterium]